MHHRGEIDHECGRTKIVDGGLCSLRAYCQNRFLKLGDGNLPISLTEGDQSNSSAHQVGNITLQEGGQGQAPRNALPCSANSKNDGYSRLNLAFAEYFREPVQDAIGPYLAK